MVRFRSHSRPGWKILKTISKISGSKKKCHLLAKLKISLSSVLFKKTNLQYAGKMWKGFVAKRVIRVLLK